MRITILGIKGGVGKSTIAITLAKALANRGRRVALVDMDVSGYVSMLSRIEGKGLVARVIDGEEIEGAHRDIHLDNGELRVIKFLGDGIRLIDDVLMLKYNVELLDKLMMSYVKLLDGYEYFIVDDSSNVTLDPNVVEHEMSIFSRFFPGDIARIYVTNAPPSSIQATVNYARRIEERYRNGYPLAVILNMVSGVTEDNLKLAEDLRSRIGARFSIVIPLINDLLNFSGNIEELPVPPQIEEIANKLIPSGTRPPIMGLGRGVVLITLPPGRDNHDFLRSLVKDALDRGRDVVVIRDPYMNSKLMIGGEEYSVSPRYRYARFQAKGIIDIIRLAKRLGNEVLGILSNKRRPVVLLVKANRFSPASGCCDPVAQREEFWMTFLNHVRNNRQDALVYLICDDIASECDIMRVFSDYEIDASTSPVNRIEAK